jgi:hypothetical protein
MTAPTMDTAPDTDAGMTTALQNNVDGARAILERAESEQRELTTDEAAEHEQLVQRATTMRDLIRRQRTVAAGSSRFHALAANVSDPPRRRGNYDAEARVGAAPAMLLTRE